MPSRSLAALILTACASLTICTSAHAQSTLRARATEHVSGGHRIVALKWITPEVVNRAKVDLYRVDLASQARVRVNSVPITKWSTPTEGGPSLDTMTTVMLLALDDASVTDPVDRESRDFLALISLGYNNELARAIGVYYEDSAAVEGHDYRYEVTRTGDARPFATSETLHVAAPSVIAAPQEPAGKAGDTKALLKWKREERFIVWNVYRSNSSEGPYSKVSKLPVFVFSYADDKGKEHYPDFYFTDSLLRNGSTYFYQVRGITEMGVESEPSSAVSITPVDQTPPPALGNLTISTLGKDALLRWSRSTATDAKGYAVYRSDRYRDGYIRITPSLLPLTDTSYRDQSIATLKPYYYYVSVEDAAGNSNRTNIANAFLRDRDAPNVPVGLTGTAAPGVITLQWTANSESDLRGYKVYRSTVDRKRDFLLLTPLAMSGARYVDSLPLTLKSTFYYRVTSIDTNYNESAQSASVAVVLPDVTAPGAPTLSELTIDSNQLELTWTRNVENDIDHYSVYRQADSAAHPVLIGTAARTASHVSVRVPNPGSALFFITAVDSSRNESLPSNRLSATISQGRTFAETVTNPTAVFDSTANSVRLSWSPGPNSAASNTTFAIYRTDSVEETIELLGTTPTSTYLDTEIASGKTYLYSIRSFAPHSEATERDFPMAVHIP
jgi:fibronectin type 3 domain-containing protein